MSLDLPSTVFVGKVFSRPLTRDVRFEMFNHAFVNPIAAADDISPTSPNISPTSPNTIQGFRYRRSCKEYVSVCIYIYIWVVVKIMVPIWFLNMIRHLVFRGPKREP